MALSKTKTCLKIIASPLFFVACLLFGLVEVLVIYAHKILYATALVVLGSIDLLRDPESKRIRASNIPWVILSLPIHIILFVATLVSEDEERISDLF